MIDSRPDSAYNRAVQEKERLELQRREIEARLADVESFLRLYVQFSAPPEPEQAAEERYVESEDAEQPGQPEQGISQAKFEAIAIEILSEAGRPMTRKSLRNAFGLRSIHIGGVNPEKNFGTKLWKAVNRPNAPLFYDKEAGYGIRSESETTP